MSSKVLVIMLGLSHLSFFPLLAVVKHEIQIIWKRQIPTNKHRFTSIFIDVPTNLNLLEPHSRRMQCPRTLQWSCYNFHCLLSWLFYAIRELTSNVWTRFREEMKDTMTRKLHNWKCTLGKMGWVSQIYQASVVPFGAVHMTMISACYTTRWIDDRNASAFQTMDMILRIRIHSTPTPHNIIH